MGHFGYWQYRQLKTEGFRAALSGAPLELPICGKNTEIQNYSKRHSFPSSQNKYMGTLTIGYP